MSTAKDVQFNFRLTKQEHSRALKLASHHELTLASLLRRLLKEEAQRIQRKLARS